MHLCRFFGKSFVPRRQHPQPAYRCPSRPNLWHLQSLFDTFTGYRRFFALVFKVIDRFQIGFKRATISRNPPYFRQTSTLLWSPVNGT